MRCIKEGRAAREDTAGLYAREGIERDDLGQIVNSANEARFFETTRFTKYLASTIEHPLRLDAGTCCEDHGSICQERRR